MKFFEHYLVIFLISIFVLFLFFILLLYFIKKKIDKIYLNSQAKKYYEDKIKVIDEQKAKVTIIENNNAIGDDVERIVGVSVKGYWTKYVLMNNIEYLKALKNLIDHRDEMVNEKGEKLGYWQLLTMASRSAKGRQRGQGR